MIDTSKKGNMQRATKLYYLFFLVCLSGCAPSKAAGIPIQNPHAARQDDQTLQKGQAYVDDANWNAQALTLTLNGSLPTPCHQLRLETEWQGSQLRVKATSLYPKEEMCAQVLEPFTAILTLAEMPPGDQHEIIFWVDDVALARESIIAAGFRMNPVRDLEDGHPISEGRDPDGHRFAIRS